MAQPAPPRHRYTYAEYLAYEQDSGLKHEYDNGEILAMAGGSRRHNALASRISAALEGARKPGCVAFQSDQKLRILATGKAAYPDASVICERVVPAASVAETITCGSTPPEVASRSVPRIVNACLSGVLAIERRWRRSFPFGLSVFCVAEKPEVTRDTIRAPEPPAAAKGWTK